MAVPFNPFRLSDVRRALRQSASLMQRVHAQVLPRARQLLNTSDELLDRSISQELASAQRLDDTGVGGASPFPAHLSSPSASPPMASTARSRRPPSAAASA